MNKGRIIIAIGDWGNMPHHALPKVDRKNRPRPARPKQSKSKHTMKPEQEPSQESQRLCTCSMPLGFRQRYCDKCKVRRRRASNRKEQRKHTKLKRSNISS